MGNLESSELTKPIEQTRERLTDEQLGNLISAVGNHEAKALTLLAMKDGNIYSKGGLHTALLLCQGEEIGWRMDKILPFGYCSYSLAPIGLVTKEALNSDLSTYGYQITDYGRKVGIPFCGLILNWSIRHGVALNRFWGRTGLPSSMKQKIPMATGEELEFLKRSPITTLKILYELTTAPDLPIRATDIANRIGQHDLTTIGDHLERLAEKRQIEYQSVEVNKPFSIYKLASSRPAGVVPSYGTLKTLTQAVFSVLQAHPDLYLTNRDVNNLLPQELKENRSEDYLHSVISRILVHLKRNNYLESKQLRKGFQSAISLNDDQRMALTELLEIIDRLQNQDPDIMAKGRKLAEEIISHPDYVSSLLRRARETSPEANKTAVPEIINLISYFIASHPGITNKNIQQLLKQTGKTLGNHRVQQLTAILEETNSIRATREGSVKRFFPKDTSVT